MIKQKIVTIRKPHICFGCEREFPAGTKMEYSFQNDGGPLSAYLCSTCQQVVHDIASAEGGYIEYGFGDLRDDALTYELEAKIIKVLDTLGDELTSEVKRKIADKIIDAGIVVANDIYKDEQDRKVKAFVNMMSQMSEARAANQQLKTTKAALKLLAEYISKIYFQTRIVDSVLSKSPEGIAKEFLHKAEELDKGETDG